LSKKIITIARVFPKYKGTSESRAEVIDELDKSLFRTIIIYIAKKSDKPNQFEENGRFVYYLTKKSNVRFFNILIIWRLVKILKKEKVRILHCHKHKSTVYGALAAKATGVPVVISHIHGINRTRNLVRKFTNFFIFRLIDKILTVGEGTLEDVKKSNFKFPSEKIVSIGNSINYKAFANTEVTKEGIREKLGIVKDKFVFGTVSRLTPVKGHNFLIEAFYRIRDKLQNSQLVIVGEGRAKADLEKQVERLGLQESVHFLGYRTDIAEVLKSFDIFVLPSIGEEGLPKAMLEAMAAGVPVIGTNISGIPEILADGKYGRLVRPGSSTALSEAMSEMMQLPEEIKKDIIASAKQRVKNHYSHSVICERIESIYEKLAQEKGMTAEYYIMSYPKSGRTWLRLMIAKLLQVHFKLRVKREHFPELKRFRQYDRRIPGIEVHHDPDTEATWSGSFGDLRKSLEQYKNTKVIFLVRDPRDVVVSHYFQDTKRPKNSPEEVFQGSISEYIRDEKLGTDGIVKFCNLWASQRDAPRDFLLIRYEDLHRDTVGELRRVADFLGIKDVSAEELEDAVEFASFRNMQNMERTDYFKRGMLRPGSTDDPDSYKTRRGKVHGFTDYLGEDDIKYLNKKLSMEMDSFFNYEFA
jgi:glycosyltransferase involved in cell wall biosynthesis